MFAPPPQVSSISLAVENLQNSLDFYLDLGIVFDKEIQSDYTRCTYNNNGFLFIIHQAKSPREVTTNLSLKFFIDDIDGYLPDIENAGLVILKNPWDSSEGRHMIYQDFENNIVELICKK